MIRNRLAELLAERHLKISKVANDIEGLSRNTITATAQNNGKMIQLETIDKLCQYLEIDINDFFEYLPFDVKANLMKPEFYTDMAYNDFDALDLYGRDFKMPVFDMDLYIDKIELSRNIGIKKHTFDLTVRISNADFETGIFTALVLLGQNHDKNSFNNQKTAFFNFLKSLGVGFKDSLLSSIKNEIKDVLINVFSKNNIFYGNDPIKNILIVSRFSFDDAYDAHSNDTFKLLEKDINGISEDDLHFKK